MLRVLQRLCVDSLFLYSYIHVCIDACLFVYLASIQMSHLAVLPSLK